MADSAGKELSHHLKTVPENHQDADLMSLLSFAQYFINFVRFVPDIIAARDSSSNPSPRSSSQQPPTAASAAYSRDQLYKNRSSGKTDSQ